MKGITKFFGLLLTYSVPGMYPDTGRVSTGNEGRHVIDLLTSYMTELEMMKYVGAR